MTYLKIEGGHKLSGTIDISGAKNAALPLIAATLLVNGVSTLKNVPMVADIKTMLNLLEHLGASCEIKGNLVKINATKIIHTKALYDIVTKMRASILVLGPLLSRFGHCEVSLPGGCAIGQRPIDLHLKALEKMGAKIVLEDGYVKASGKLFGTNVHFDKVTVGGTENTILAAVYASGTTIISNAAQEPEIVNLCEFLINAGVKIKGVGTSTLEITGLDSQITNDVECEIIPDRIEAGTYLCAAAITNSNIKVNKLNPNHLTSLLNKFDEMQIKYSVGNDYIELLSSENLKAVNIETSEYPGFPTDMQAQFMALCTQADGLSIIEERLFENRFMHAGELNRMGAKIVVNTHSATLSKSKLQGADVKATDLRAGSALVIAALAANGITNIHKIHHLERGYENLCEKLQKVGANIQLLKEEE